MFSLLKKYWDIFGGALLGIAIALLSKFDLIIIQLCYSIIILILVSIGALRIIKQAIEKREKGKKKQKRQHNIIDGLIDTQKPVKAISLATHPTQEGEKLGNLLIETYKRGRKIMNKIKKFLDKFKGYILAIALGLLTVIELCGGPINAAFGNALVFKGVEILPILTLGLSIVVAGISNGFTTEQKEQLKALFAKKTTNELVVTEIKKNIKTNEATLKELNKALTNKESELENLESQLESAKNTHQAKQEMFKMIPQLATDIDVQNAANEVVNYEAKIVEKKQEIEKVNQNIIHVTTTINALKSQL